MQSTMHYLRDDGAEYHAKRRIPERSLERVCGSRAKKFQPFIKPTDVVFEYGCGSGWNLARLTAARRIGYDVSPILKKEITSLGLEWCADVEAVPASMADVVICHHTLEHVPHPMKSLAEIRRILKPGGRLLLSVPFEKGSRARRYRPDDKDHHIYSWTVQTLGNLVKDCGFRIDEIGLKPFGYDRIVAVATDKLPALAYRSLLWLAQRFGGEREVFVIARPS